ncbi:hypothetical protein [Streptacidiphilus rugosus]|uniref:hypothetical protein n=1 Tax=Streptacidiphilus rugosus TaxID=405783 RepID=UPI00056904C7|nr:hypothetical protein [Streptacidiphilus rugosus]
MVSPGVQRCGISSRPPKRTLPSTLAQHWIPDRIGTTALSVKAGHAAPVSWLGVRILAIIHQHASQPPGAVRW